MKIFTGAQVKELDKYTIEHEPIKSEDLMERAADALTRAITASWGTDTAVVVFAGPGNNGGDALAVARMLAEKDYRTTAYLFNIGNTLSEDCTINKKRLQDCKKLRKFIEVTNEFDPPRLEKGMLVIDGLFGSGLNKPLAGGFASLVKYINQSPAQVVSIDIPSGLMSEDNTYSVRANIIKADMTLTLQQKKLSFMFPENQNFIGKLQILDIGLSKDGIESIPATYSVVEEKDIKARILHRNSFAHKGDMGSALLIAGSYGMAGAAVLAAKACLRSGAGKVTVGTPKRNNDILQISVPEAIVHHDKDDKYFTEPIDVEEFDALGIGPGLGQNENTAIALITQIRKTQVPIVLDADALNILASHRAWLQQLPKGIIMTPHPKEFERLAGNHYVDSYERLCKAQSMAQQLHAYIILKGHHSALCLPDGTVIFNSTGNAGMATAGSGDVLTGIITGLLARGYKQAEACLTGMYLHGIAGDIAAKETGMESLTAGDLIEKIPQAFAFLDK
ncbi:NAD(P)H-hydrate dehydratase [Xylanibacter caecicola]|uniref:NAD(P)H-hydrate dehydratase n=1 Tax=Xylanibacter caecicola TaxID=2736294 RepID=UPI0025885162|nr:NAD(P)H-hydrate dehydratase [Xylanibacter caecicola]